MMMADWSGRSLGYSPGHIAASLPNPRLVDPRFNQRKQIAE